MESLQTQQDLADKRLVSVLGEMTELKKFQVRATRLPVGAKISDLRNGKRNDQTVLNYGGERYLLSGFMGASPKHIDGPEYRGEFPELLEVEQTCVSGGIRLRVLKILNEAQQAVELQVA